MTRSWIHAAAIALIITASHAVADDKPAVKGDLAKLQGTWTGKAGPEKNYTIDVTFDGSKVVAKVVTPDDQTFDVKGEVVLDENAKPHKTINWVKFTGPNGDDVADNLGIYVFESNDTIKFCNGGPGNERPTEFKAGDDGGPQLFELKRSKAKPADDKPAEVKGDLARLQGTWTTKVGPERNVELAINFKGNAVTLHITGNDGQERTLKGEAVLDETAKPHKVVTFKNFTRPDGTAVAENLGIYTFENDDTVKFCTGGPGNDRPTEFKAGEGGPPQLLTLQRKK